MKMSKIEAGIRLVLEYNKAFNRHDVAGMVRLMSDDCLFENASPAPDGALFSGKEAITLYWQDFFSKSPHARAEIEDIFGLGNRCIMRWRHDWVDATGEEQHLRGVDLFQVRSGLISEKLSYVKG